jgi:hypothetical protein
VFFVAGTLLATAIGVMWGVWRVRRTGRAITRLADELGAPRLDRWGRLARSLATRARCAYWLPSSGRFVDSSGRRSTATRAGSGVDNDRARRPTGRGRDPRSRGLCNRAWRCRRLAVDSERLRAEVLAQLGDLRVAGACFDSGHGTTSARKGPARRRSAASARRVVRLGLARSAATALVT